MNCKSESCDRDANNNITSNRNRRFQLMCLPMKSRSAFSTICYLSRLSSFWLGPCMGKYWTYERPRAEWLLTDNIQHRYLMPSAYYTFFMGKLFGRKIWFKRSAAESKRKANPSHGKTAIDDDYNLWLWCLFTSAEGDEANSAEKTRNIGE